MKKIRTYKTRWWWIIVRFKRDSDLHIGIALMDYLLLSQIADKGYYCRYTGEEPRIEIKCVSCRSQNEIKTALISTCKRYGFSQPLRITFKEFVGSDAHAQATLVVMKLSEQNQLTDASVLRDVIHWMYNMSGFSYVQEIESALREAHDGLRSIVGKSWTERPYFYNPKAYTPPGK